MLECFLSRYTFRLCLHDWNCRARQPSPLLRVNSEEVIELTPSPTLPVNSSVYPQNSSITTGSTAYVTATFDTDNTRI